MKELDLIEGIISLRVDSFFGRAANTVDIIASPESVLFSLNENQGPVVQNVVKLLVDVTSNLLSVLKYGKYIDFLLLKKI